MLDIIFNSIIPFVIILTILVFVHELGHYLAAIKNNVKVEVFSIGFGKELFGFTDNSGTRWKFSLLPLGGYVKMHGDADESSTKQSKDNIDLKKSFHNKINWSKICNLICRSSCKFYFFNNFTSFYKLFLWIHINQAYN